MEKISTLLRSAVVMLLSVGIFSSCSKSVEETEETGPKETIVLPMFDGGSNPVGSVYIDDMNGRAQARIVMDEGKYTMGENMKANATLTAAGNTSVYANCTDVDGMTGKCSTFPIKVLNSNSDATFSDVITTNGLVFNVLDKNGNIVARSSKYVVFFH